MALFASRQADAPRISRSRSGPAVYRLIRAGVTAIALGAATVTPAFAEQPILYTVRAGDTLIGIAEQFSVPVDSLVSANGLSDPDRIIAGQTLRITSSSSAMGSPAAGSASGSAEVPHGHTVWTTAHYPAFAITPDGIVVRTLSPDPPPPKIIDAPYHSQFDGSIWAESNCGPTALSMALGALGLTVDQITLRQYANQQMGAAASPYNGTTWESLAYAARKAGAKVSGLFAGQQYRTWTLADLKTDLAKGHPVLLLVRYWDLPDHAGSSFAGDHYIVALGFDNDGNLVYHDPAFHGDGSDRTISPSALNRAWTNTAVGLVRTAMAVYR
ncbi:MAG: C39 family peptidase [Chloroflexi bacterium]|nr:C39 family peptidase [Chloroflexota bacterium]